MRRRPHLLNALALGSGIVLVVPYSLLADKYGVKRVLILSVLGVLLGEAWYDLVCKFRWLVLRADATAEKTLIAVGMDRLLWRDVVHSARMAVSDLLPRWRWSDSVHGAALRARRQSLSSRTSVSGPFFSHASNFWGKNSGF